MNSISLPVPSWVAPLLPAYEERFLCLVLALLRQPGTRVVYVTSQPIHPRLIDYWFRLVPRLDRDEARRRGTFISLSDSSLRPLTAKMLERPRLLERIRQTIVAPERSLILPFVVTDLERRLAVELGIPVYGPDPELARFGTKTGGRRLFADVGVPVPVGFEGLTSLGDVVEAIDEIRTRRPSCRQVIVKLDDSVSGLGNGIVTIGDGGEAPARAIALEDTSLSGDDFYDLVGERGAIVEERIAGEDFRSPSVQLRVRPDGEVEVLSTHDQILGGPSEQMYVGCRLPADPEYAVTIAAHGRVVAERLRDEGVIGRFALDFVTVRENGSWSPYAVEINLRNGGTSYPLFTALRAHRRNVRRRCRPLPRGVRARQALRRDRRPRGRLVPLPHPRRPARRRGRRAPRLGRGVPGRRRVPHGQRAGRRGPRRPDGDRRLARGGTGALPPCRRDHRRGGPLISGRPRV